MPPVLVAFKDIMSISMSSTSNVTHMIWEYSSSRRHVEMQSIVQSVFSTSASVASGTRASVLEP